jgi:Cu2+-exporting ATPase
MSPPDISVSFPAAGVIRVQSEVLFGDADGPSSRQFIECAFGCEAISCVSITAENAPRADLYYCSRTFTLPVVVRGLKAALGQGLECEVERAPGEAEVLRIGPSSSARDDRGILRYYRYDSLVTGWEVRSEVSGRLRLRNRTLFRQSCLCQAIERELTGVLGVDGFSTNSIMSSVLVEFDPDRLTGTQIIEILDAALAGAQRASTPDALDMHLPLCTISIPLAASAQFGVPALLPLAAALYAYTSVPTFKEAHRVLVKENRIGVDALDAVVMVGCLGTLSIFPGAICCWCLSFGRFLVRQSRDRSQRLLLNAFGKQPRYAWLCGDVAAEQVPTDQLKKGDVIVVHTGEVVPADGHVVDGMAMVDQQMLTGESTPAEKGLGDRMFASTLVLAGEVRVAVETSGEETTSARIGQILRDTAGYRMSSQHKGERLADKAVFPTLGAGALGLATMGPTGAVAVLNSDLGTGIRMAAPLAMLSSLSLCASRGILVRDGRALEHMHRVDTFLFDKTGTLTREQPEVGRVFAACGWDPGRILAFAAAAERKFHHPIALAILEKAKELGLRPPLTDDTQYKVGYGVTVKIHGSAVRVGSRRFIESEGIELSAEMRAGLDESHDEGHTTVLVAVDDRVAGTIELRATVRPEVGQIITELRRSGVRHIAIISGDHEAPTRRLAESLGMDRYFAQVLPADKAEYVERLQREGRKVCFVGDGINDSIALKKADVSISLRGASTLATDTAQVVFLEGGLSRLCELREIAHNLDRNVNRSWSMIVAPNVANVIGVFTLGSGIMTSVVTNNVSALAALANGLLPLRKVKRSGLRGRSRDTMPAERRNRGSAASRRLGSPGGGFWVVSPHPSDPTALLFRRPSARGPAPSFHFPFTVEGDDLTASILRAIRKTLSLVDQPEAIGASSSGMR